MGPGPFFRPKLAAGGPAAETHAGLDADQARRFRELALPHLDSAYNLARYLARDATAAEDIVQDAFLRAFRAFPDYRGGSAKAWLFAIVRNCFLDWAGGRARGGGVLIAEGALSAAEALSLSNIADPEQVAPDEALSRRHEAEAIRALIRDLPEPFRETLVLREMEELSYKEIAALTGTPIGTVMSRLARARQMLADVLLPMRDVQANPRQKEAGR